MSRTGAISAGVSLPESLFPDEPRRELGAGTTGVDLELGGVVVRAGDLPLLRKQDGALRQCLRLAMSADGDRGVARFSSSLPGPASIAPHSRPAPARPRCISSSAVDEATTVELEIELDGGLRRVDTLIVKPQRRWRIFVVHHSHLDIGYTDPQACVLRTAPRLSRLRTRLRRTQRRFPLDDREQPRPRALARKPAAGNTGGLLALLRTRRFEVCALPFTMHAEAFSIDELCAAASVHARLRDRYGVDVVSAMQTDVPGGPPGLPLVLADAHVPYLAVAHNWAASRDALPDRRGRAAARVPLGGQTGQAGARVAHRQPSRDRVPRRQPARARRVDDPAGELLPEYLAALSTRGHPYTGSLGVPVDRRSRTHTTSSISASRASTPTMPRRASRPPRSPGGGTSTTPFRGSVRRRIASSSKPSYGRAADLRRGLGGLVGGRARLGGAPVGFNRRAQAIVRTAQTLHTLAGPETEHAADADRVYESMSLFDEHTWCAAHPGGDALAGRESGAAAVAGESGARRRCARPRRIPP